MCIVSFKERVKNEAIANAGLYEANFINFEYLICSEAFRRSLSYNKVGQGKLFASDWNTYKFDSRGFF